MAPVLLVAIAVALWAGVLDKVVQLWRAPEDLPLRALAACVVSATLTFTANLPPLRPLLDLAGPGVRTLVINFGTMAAAYFLLVFFVYSVRGPAGRRAVRWQAVPLATGILAAFAAWALAPSAVRTHPADTANGASLPAAVFVVAVLGYMAYAHSQSLRWSIAYLRAVGTVRLRVSLAVISLAVCAFLVADTSRSVLAVLQAATGLTGGAVSTLSAVYLAGVGVGALSFVIGVSFVAVNGMLRALPLRREHRRRHRQLEPLWTAMDHAFPHLILGRVPATSWRGRLGPGGVHYRFYRRVVEVRDGLVQLSPYLDAPPAGPAQGSTETRWAEAIRDALRRRERDGPVVDADPVLIPGGDDLESDARVLAGIAHAFATLPPGGGATADPVPAAP
jgi:hypothetical protein